MEYCQDLGPNVGVVPFVWFAFVAIFISIAASRNWSEVVLDQSKLPKDLQTIVNKFPNKPVVYHQLRNGFNLGMTQRGVIRIEGTGNVDRFIESAKLEVVDGSHPERREFDKSLLLGASTPAVVTMWYHFLLID